MDVKSFEGMEIMDAKRPEVDLLTIEKENWDALYSGQTVTGERHVGREGRSSGIGEEPQASMEPVASTTSAVIAILKDDIGIVLT